MAGTQRGDSSKTTTAQTAKTSQRISTGVKASASKATKETATKSRLPLFEKENFMWMVIGGIVAAIGMLLMSGGKNPSADQFDYRLVYSTTRVTIAPILILAGFIIEIYAIFKRPKAQQQETTLS